MSVPFDDLLPEGSVITVTNPEGNMAGSVVLFGPQQLWQFVDAIEKRSIQMFLERVDKERVK